MYELYLHNQFEKDLKKCKKQGKDINKLAPIIARLRNGEVLKEFRQHNLVGNWKGKQELHINSDWLLIFFIEDNILQLVATGSHSDLFNM